MQIFIATYEHKHGTDVRAFKTESGARAWKAAIAQEWWDTELDTPMPQAEPPNVIGDMYFDAMADRSYSEYFTLTEAKIED